MQSSWSLALVDWALLVRFLWVLLNMTVFLMTFLFLYQWSISGLPKETTGGDWARGCRLRRIRRGVGSMIIASTILVFHLVISFWTL
jgi:hypothetical protein